MRCTGAYGMAGSIGEPLQRKKIRDGGKAFGVGGGTQRERRTRSVAVLAIIGAWGPFQKYATADNGTSDRANPRDSALPACHQFPHLRAADFFPCDADSAAAGRRDSDAILDPRRWRQHSVFWLPDTP